MVSKYGYVESNELSDYCIAHHGIKGQKWGIRKYQNEDGSLTELGKQRYNYQGVKKLRKISKAGRIATVGGAAVGTAGLLLSPATAGISLIPAAVGGTAATVGPIVAGIADLTLHEVMSKTSNKEFEKMKKDRNLMNDPVSYLSAKQRDRVNEYTKSK